MNTAEDIKRMLGELVDEAIRIGRAEGEKTLGTDAALKEQVKRLTDDKRNLTQSLDHVIEENNDLELTIGKLKAELEWTESEIVKLRDLIDDYERTSTEASKEIDMLKAKTMKLDGENDRLFNENSDLWGKLEDADAKVKELNEALAIYRVPVPRDCPFCGGPAEVHQLRQGEWYVACGNGDCPVNPETNTFDTEADAIEAWNNSYNAPKVTCDWR